MPVFFAISFQIIFLNSHLSRIYSTISSCVPHSMHLFGPYKSLPCRLSHVNKATLEMSQRKTRTFSRHFIYQMSLAQLDLIPPSLRNVLILPRKYLNSLISMLCKLLLLMMGWLWCSVSCISYSSCLLRGVPLSCVHCPLLQNSSTTPLLLVRSLYMFRKMCFECQNSALVVVPKRDFATSMHPELEVHPEDVF